MSSYLVPGYMKSNIVQQKQFSSFFSSIWPPAISHPPANSPLSFDGYQLRRVLVNMYFLWNTWNQPTRSFWTVARAAAQDSKMHSS